MTGSARSVRFADFGAAAKHNVREAGVDPSVERFAGSWRMDDSIG